MLCKWEEGSAAHPPYFVTYSEIISLEPKLYVCFNMLWVLNNFDEYIYSVKKGFIQEERD